MDYQRNGWFRPTCGVANPHYANRTAPISHSDAPVKHDSTGELAHIHPTSLAMVYSPSQQWRMTYEPMKALSRGTLFAELDKPFTGKC